MIRRTRRGDIITNRHLHSTKPWFHFPVRTPMERITVATAPVISMDERAATEAGPKSLFGRVALNSKSLSNCRRRLPSCCN